MTSNVIYAPFSTPSERQAASVGRLLHNFATERRAVTDVFWLKENGELLNILESTGAQVPQSLLAPHRATYDEIAERLAFFPQYYRFILSIALDLEDLGLEGNLSEAMCDWVVAQGLAEGETSDIQRLEAKRLLARRGRVAHGLDAGLDDRMRAFVSQPERFALPNKKAAYELTHIVFYLSEYGRKCPQLGRLAFKSLENVGIWAFLDGNIDLLAEICIAMRYAGYNPSGLWEEWIAQKMTETTISVDQGITKADDYHAVFMAAWLGGMRGGAGLDALAMPQADGTLNLTLPDTRTGALGQMSRGLYAIGGARSSDWDAMRGLLCDRMSPDAAELVKSVETECDGFGAFFESFSRTSQILPQGMTA